MKGRRTLLVFSLRRPSIVEFVVIEIAPDCRRVGRFRALGRTGVNRLRFRGRFGGKELRPGTYRITARTVPGGRSVVDTELVIVTSPDQDEIASGRRANACGSASIGQSSSSADAVATASNPSATPRSATPRDRAEKPPAPEREKGVLGARFTKAVDAVKGIPLWLFVLLGLAIAILAVAALPLRAAPTRRAASFLARHRGAVAITGAAVLLAVTVAYTLH